MEPELVFEHKKLVFEENSAPPVANHGMPSKNRFEHQKSSFPARWIAHKTHLHRATIIASNSLIKNSALIEFALLGLISGILGALMSYSGVYFIEPEVFQTTANFYPELFVLGPAIGLIVVSGLCLYLINGIVKKSPKELFT